MLGGDRASPRRAVAPPMRHGAVETSEGGRSGRGGAPLVEHLRPAEEEDLSRPPSPGAGLPACTADAAGIPTRAQDGAEEVNDVSSPVAAHAEALRGSCRNTVYLSFKGLRSECPASGGLNFEASIPKLS